jgi:hypothetical protein
MNRHEMCVVKKPPISGPAMLDTPNTPPNSPE